MKNESVRYRKIRGLNRRKRDIIEWGERNTPLDLDYLEKYHSDYVKFRVRPWSDLSLKDSIYPEPTGECEYLLIKYLNNIYQSWYATLESTNIAYYLQIWLYEEQVRRSQVVCAIKDRKDFYHNTFERIINQPDNGIQSSIHYHKETPQFLDIYEWELYREIMTYDVTDDWDCEMIERTPPSKLLRKQIIHGKEHQIVEIDKVWLIKK